MACVTNAAGKNLGDGHEFPLTWTMNEAVVLSFEGTPPRAQE